jgi:hypothetical protein
VPSGAVPVIDSFPSTLSNCRPVCHKVQSLSWPVLHLHFHAVFLRAAKCSIANRIDGRAAKVCRDLMGVSVRTLDDVLKPSVTTEAAKQAIQLLALHEGPCRTDEGSK